MVNKVLRNLLPIYAIRVLEIQEMRCHPKNNINLDTLLGRFTTFELDKFDNYVPNFGSIEVAFQAKLSLKKKGGKSKRKKSNSEDEDNSDNDLEVLKALLASRFPQGKGKYKGKIPLIFFLVKKLVTLLQSVETKREKR